ncbi:hypothetical protein C7448_101543 [Tenacibaculum gallaicum]|uniref:Outer membrane beta-barrel porin/alpha-amylase n=1 Tax=Tenacibaculum gallaicum TaxID=561505 RepID=A0A3E0ID45_9FLAO|nr:transporter [Tenacibaculum gallaicum]REH56503.1 hypothetical protein C7448_101543 [Tenacibaculum gallaicum]
MKRQLVSFSILLFFVAQISNAQDDKVEKANIQTYTPSKLLNNGQWDVKWFNNLYTETKFADADGNTRSKLRENYFTSTLEAFTGISKNNRINVGAIVEFRSNTIGGRQALSVFSLKDNRNTERKGITSIAPAIKFQPLKNVGNFSVQSAVHIPLVSNETENGVFLDQTAWAFQNRFFYDYTFSSGKWQLFTELNTEYNFGNDDSFANNTFVLAPGIFFSYFPNDKSTVLAFTQHSQRFGDFTQDYTALGLGGKYQISKTLNLEVLYSNFVRGTNNGLGQSFNLGLRALF